MEENKLDYNTKQVIITRLLENMEATNEEGKRKILSQLLEHTDTMFLHALSFAIDMTPNQKPTNK
jgi:hypothetical protein